MHPTTIAFQPPDERFHDTSQLATCLDLLQSLHSPDDVEDPAARRWLLAIDKDTDEQEHIKMLATDVIRAVTRDELGDASVIAEVICLAPVLGRDDFRYLLREFYMATNQCKLLDFNQLRGLVQLVQGVDLNFLDSDDLVGVLELIHTRLQNTHKQSQHHIYQLTLALSHLLDVMVDINIQNVDRERLHQPILSYLMRLIMDSPDTYLVFQAAYAYQALLCIPDDGTLLRLTRKHIWYSALRGADCLIQDGELPIFKRLVCEAPCRRDPAFQYGVCQRLGAIAANSMWDPETRRSAVDFLGEIYRNDEAWGQRTSTKRYVLDILMQLCSLFGEEMQCKWEPRMSNKQCAIDCQLLNRCVSVDLSCVFYHRR